jgi:hypothetical protein
MTIRHRANKSEIHRQAMPARAKAISIALAALRLTRLNPSCIVGVRLYSFLLTRKYQLFDNWMIHARTRLVYPFRFPQGYRRG